MIFLARTSAYAAGRLLEIAGANRRPAFDAPCVGRAIGATLPPIDVLAPRRGRRVTEDTVAPVSA